MSIQLYVIRSPRKLSNGERQNGRWRGHTWTEGYAGPFDEQTATRVLNQVGGSKHGFGSVPEKAVMRELQRIEDKVSGESLFEEKELPDLTGEDDSDEDAPEEKSSDEESEGFEAVEETAEELSENEVNIFPEEATYHEMLRYMGQEDFDWQDLADGRSSEEVTRVYKEEFLPSRSL